MSELNHSSSPALTARAHYVRRPGDEPAVQGAPIRAKRRPQYGQIVTGFVAIALLALFIQSQAQNPNMEWGVTWEYMFNPVVLEGVGVTIQLAIFAMLISIVLAFVIALMIQSNNKVASIIGRGYVWFFRGVPMLVQVLLWFNLAVLFPKILGQDTNSLISGFTAGLIALSLAESGYMAEIIRGGIISVPAGQTDAGVSIGLTRNQFIGMLKATSLVSVIGGSDLLTRVQLIYGQNFKILPLLIVAVLWYLILVTIAGVGQHFLERRFNASQPGSRKPRKHSPAGAAATTTTTGGAP